MALRRIAGCNFWPKFSKLPDLRLAIPLLHLASRRLFALRRMQDGSSNARALLRVLRTKIITRRTRGVGGGVQYAGRGTCSSRKMRELRRSDARWRDVSVLSTGLWTHSFETSVDVGRNCPRGSGDLDARGCSADSVDSGGGSGTGSRTAEDGDRTRDAESGETTDRKSGGRQHCCGESRESCRRDPARVAVEAFDG